MDTLLARHKLNVDDYYRMGEAGILREGERVELIDGEVIDMVPIGSGHSGNINRLTRALVLACGDRAVVGVQNPVRLDRFNEPQPDFAVLRPRADFYTDWHAGAGDVLLLIEVADSSLRFDRTVKLPLYARFGIAEVWIVNRRDWVLEAYRAPAGGKYTVSRDYRESEWISLSAAPEIGLAVADALG